MHTHTHTLTVQREVQNILHVVLLSPYSISVFSVLSLLWSSSFGDRRGALQARFVGGSEFKREPNLPDPFSRNTDAACCIFPLVGRCAGHSRGGCCVDPTVQCSLPQA